MARRVKIDRAKETYWRGQILARAESGLTVSAYCRQEFLPKSPIGQSIAYAMNNWAALCRYLEDGDLAIDNNLAERTLRPLAVGRKNWLFAGSDRGGRTAAILTSFTQTCKDHGIDPCAYLHDVLDRIANHTIKKLSDLLPDNRQNQNTTPQT